ncbi:MAG: 16S rRNA (adenine(1518)-N(6)/adenine(1519)-N(6))-dimethyltransferase RsmA [Luteibaculum sp.]
MVRAKKHLGQHFLASPEIARDIAEAIQGEPKVILEVGPGTGALTAHLLDKSKELYLSEIDRESVSYLQENFSSDAFQIVQQSFLDAGWEDILEGPFTVAGNFPYNISSQIVFKVLEMKDSVPQVVGMFQKELAERICAGPGGKTYGVISVLTQAFYDCEYLFTVPEHVFIPPPKVKSGVIRLTRHNRALRVDESTLRAVVKATFNQRRKTIRNGIKSLGRVVEDHPLLAMRPEQLSLAEFEELCLYIFPERAIG